jgi:hypothetical protein
MFEIAQAQPAPFLFHGDAVQAQRAHRLATVRAGSQSSRRSGGQRRDLLVGKAPAASRIIRALSGRSKSKSGVARINRVLS